MVPEDKTPGNFKNLWLKYDVGSSHKHQLFIKDHSVRKQEPGHPKGRTLFILNVPPYVTNDSLKRVFIRYCGGVTSVSLHSASKDSRNGFKIGYIVFAKESSLDKALALPKDLTVVLETEGTLQNPLGISKWCREYNEEANVNEQTTKEEIDKYMAAYDKRIEACLAAESTTQEDADGWVTVSSKKKRGQFAPSRKESTIGKVQQREQEKSKKKQLLNFYTFQIRESKKQHLAELRKKFEMDKQKIQKLKSTRTFKPVG